MKQLYTGWKYHFIEKITDKYGHALCTCLNAEQNALLLKALCYRQENGYLPSDISDCKEVWLAANLIVADLRHGERNKNTK